MVVVSTAKAHEQFKAYSLAKLMGILKSHESAVTKETNVVSSMGSLAIISKGKNVAEEEEEDLDLSEYDLTSEDYALMVSNPKKFIRRRFPAKKNQNWQGSYSAEKAKEEPKSVSQTEESKKDGNTVDDEFGDVEVWSTDSKDEEVRKPTHGRALLVKEEVVAGKCLMVTSGVSQMRDYTTDGGLDEAKEREDKCFAAKPVSEQINECDELMKKFARLSKDKTKVLKEKAVVYQKVQTTPNQVYTVKGVTQQQSAELTALVEEDNVDGCDEFFWSTPIDNADETVGLSKKTSWRVKGRREELRGFRSLQDGGSVKYGNNSFGTIKVYGMITNGDFSIRKVAYVKGLQHNLISVPQLVVGTGLKVSFDDDGSEIIEKKTNNILLKSKRKGEMYPLNLNPIRGKLAVEPETINTSLDHSDWLQMMQDELNEFDRNKVWRLIPTPKDASVVGLKWVFRNKMDKEGNMIRNKARLVVKGYC
ncbi:uncharacterized protein LOC128126844 [Lactuca sativa]|uniref:uncharacterized protein LOC128126844 n=1 Tax=Lactuca sativa TaxID=4236 RepID=UPI0022AF33D1|nr:uncharacterized protein LOC128126844 [Lactuca sativa]